MAGEFCKATSNGLSCVLADGHAPHPCEFRERPCAVMGDAPCPNGRGPRDCNAECEDHDAVGLGPVTDAERVAWHKEMAARKLPGELACWQCSATLGATAECATCAAMRDAAVKRAYACDLKEMWPNGVDQRADNGEAVAQAWAKEQAAMVSEVLGLLNAERRPNESTALETLQRMLREKEREDANLRERRDAAVEQLMARASTPGLGVPGYSPQPCDCAERNKTAQAGTRYWCSRCKPSLKDTANGAKEVECRCKGWVIPRPCECGKATQR